VPEDASRLAILKALGDNTRYAIYLELARSPRPLSTGEIADTLDLHPNTVRPHLERMRDVGILDQTVESRGAVGRPQHRYSLVPDAPSLGLEPPVFPTLARMLVRMGALAGVERTEAVEAGREQGEADAAQFPVGTPCEQALMAQLDLLGFDPEIDGGDGAVTVAFTRCPFRDLAVANPDLVCGLHRGMVEGLVQTVGGAQVRGFQDVAARTPCQVELVPDPEPEPEPVASGLSG
jgi:predicted ArsR family transcriptional regulator